MAERRMFSSKIVCSDAFTEMPFSAQALYYQLGVEADDDGFLNSPRKVMRNIEATEADLNLLLEKRFILRFPNGVIAIKHWRINNQIRKDRYTATQYQDEFNSLEIKPDGAYTEKEKEAVDGLATTWQPDGNHLATQYRLGKDSIGKDNISCPSDDDEKPDLSETYKTIISYLNEKAGTAFKHTTAKTKTAIHARLSEGFTLDDFKTVIEKKCADWMGDPKMQKYLRPETLFGTKFEGYLNENNGRNGNNGQASGNSCKAERIGTYV